MIFNPAASTTRGVRAANPASKGAAAGSGAVSLPFLTLPFLKKSSQSLLCCNYGNSLPLIVMGPTDEESIIGSRHPNTIKTQQKAKDYHSRWH